MIINIIVIVLGLTLTRRLSSLHPFSDVKAKRSSFIRSSAAQTQQVPSSSEQRKLKNPHHEVHEDVISLRPLVEIPGS